MTTEKFQLLLEGYLNGQLSNHELDRFLSALDEPVHQEQVLQFLESKLRETTTMSNPEFIDRGYEGLIELISHGTNDPGSSVLPLPPARRLGRQLLKYAAIVITSTLIISGIWYQLANRQRRSAPPDGKAKATQQVDALHHPYIAFADGDIIVLDSLAEKSERLRQLGAAIDLKNRRVTLPTHGQPSGTTSEPATLVTPRGCQYSITLSDGSTVWLNALSKLQFPLQFPNSGRQVALIGEGFFDISPNPTLPFRVGIGSVAITVLGTQFNIQAYTGNSALRTTLLQGKVKVSDEKRHFALAAGQVLLISGAKWNVSRAVDTSQVVAWKQQLFDFRKADLRTILPELARWYDITYEIPPKVKKTFSGRIPRTADISTVLQILKESDIRYRQEGKKIVFY
ncbi:FecR family protein [Chitinophaga tropicalis]|uniref:DUF4974 domain-containing protein n=1 Tax=Chitinophaga tropicalis TaxID=2683588 RepID=A0A7K1U048_9BACT|nr:FecR family protein [Chitinophaga tropicalis]MVT07676.1 DUF4974 domain-containing protein [Chitinophaga tropicalis]